MASEFLTAANLGRIAGSRIVPGHGFREDYRSAGNHSAFFLGSERRNEKPRSEFWQMSTKPPYPRAGWGGREDGVPFMKAVNEYRAKAFECLSLAECMNDPEERAEMLRFARTWMNLAEPVKELRGAYELPPADEKLSI
jgi:hypothetical protein